MLTQKVIFKLLNIKKSSRIVLFAIVGFSLGFYLHTDSLYKKQTSLSDLTTRYALPFPD